MNNTLDKAPLSDRLRVIPQTYIDPDTLLEIIEGYFVQKWYGFRWPFGLWVTDTDIGTVGSETEAIERCVNRHKCRPLIDDLDLIETSW